MPDTLNYMIIGYLVAVLILGGLAAYIVVRQRQLKAEDAELTAMVEESSSTNKS